MDKAGGKREGTKVLRGFNLCQNQIKKRQKLRQTDRQWGYPAMRCRIETVALHLFFCLSFCKGNTSQEIMGWVSWGRLWAKISSAIQTQCVSNRANFLWLLDKWRQHWLNVGFVRKQDAFTLLLPFLFSSPVSPSLPLLSHPNLDPHLSGLNFLSTRLPASLFPPTWFPFCICICLFLLLISRPCAWTTVDNASSRYFTTLPETLVAIMFLPCFLCSSCSTTFRGSAASWSPEPGSTQQRLPAHWATSTPSTLSTEIWSQRTSYWTHRATSFWQILACAKRTSSPTAPRRPSAVRQR